MRAFMKNCLKIACFSIGIGMVLTIIGFSMDNSILSFIDNNYNFSTHYEDDDLIDIDELTVIDGNANNDTANNHTDSSGNEDVTVMNENEDSDFSQSYQDVKSIVMDISYGTVILKEGDEFHIEASSIPEVGFESIIEDGKWSIRYDKDGDNDNDEISIFGIDISVGTAMIGTTDDSVAIVVTIPEDFVAENLEINLGAGTIKVDKLVAEEAIISVGAGNCTINDLTVKEEADLSVDTGELYIEDINAKDVTLECGVGNLEATGKITGDSYVTNEIGNIDLRLDGNEDNYNYSVDCGIGTVIINNNRYTGVATQTAKNDGAENSFNLDCGIGKITLKIK